MNKKTLYFILVTVILAVASFLGCCLIDYMEGGAKMFFVMIASLAAGSGSLICGLCTLERLAE